MGAQLWPAVSWLFYLGWTVHNQKRDIAMWHHVIDCLAETDKALTEKRTS